MANVHAPHVEALAATGDWAGLVRYELVHQHNGALSRALEIVRVRAEEQGGRWRPLVELLQDVQRAPLSLERQPSPGWDSLEWSREERATLDLLLLYPKAVLCETATAYPASMQTLLLRTGIEAAEQICALAGDLGDDATRAFFLRLIAHAHLTLQRFEEARAELLAVLAIYHALAEWRPEVYRPDVAMTLNSLGVAHQNLNALHAARDAYVEALAIRRELARSQPESYGPDLAMTLDNLGATQRALGEREAARDSYAEALTLYRELARSRPQVFQADLARALENLGAVQAELGDLPAVRDVCTEALTLYRELASQQPDVYGPLAVLASCKLGKAQAELNQPAASRDCCTAALPGLRELALAEPETYQPLLASTLNTLGAAQEELKQLEAARDSFDEALANYRELALAEPEGYQLLLARALSNLGSALGDLNQPEGARDRFLEALDIQRDLAQSRPEVYLPDVAATLCNLGVAQRKLNQAEAARTSCTEALAIYQELADPSGRDYLPEMARALNGLGIAEAELNDPRAAQNHFAMALTIYEILALSRPEVYRADLARTLGYRGNVQRDLSELEEARDSYAVALALYRELDRSRPEVYRLELAHALTGLGNAQWALNEGNAARDSYTEALALYRELARSLPEVYRPDVARALNNLGNAQMALDDPKAARDSYTEALAFRRELALSQPEVYRPLVANTVNGLAAIQAALGEREAARDGFTEALTRYRELARSRPEVYRPAVARTLGNLGTVQLELSALEAARNHLTEAAQLYEQDAATRPTDRLTDGQRIWTNLGQLYLGEDNPCHDLEQARNALRHAHACAESFRGRFRDLRHRRRTQREALHVSELLFQTCLDIHAQDHEEQALQEAAEVAESTRARNLWELLADEALQPANTPPDRVEQLRALRQQLRRAEQNLLYATGPHTTGSDLADDASSAQRRARLREEIAGFRQQYTVALDAIREQFDYDFDPDQPVPPISFAAMRDLLPADVPTAIVQYTLTERHGVALLLTRDGLQAVELPDLNARRAQDLHDCWSQAHRGAGERGPREWSVTFREVLDKVAREAVWPVLAALASQGIERLILSPNRALHLFPLHACRLEDGRYLAEGFEVVYTPSLSILQRCASRRRPHPDRLVAVSRPTNDLWFSGIELIRLRPHFAHWEHASGKQATREWLLGRSAEGHVCHYSGHSVFQDEDPLSSALRLAGTEQASWLTLRDVYTALHLPANVLVVLGGCESGRFLPDQVDEYVGLPGGFLYAGAQCVLCSLWPVDQLATALLLDRFYQEWLPGGKPPGAALRAAQSWLRSLTGWAVQEEVLTREFLAQVEDERQREWCRTAARRKARESAQQLCYSDPVYWSGFIATGLAYPLPQSREPSWRFS